MKKRRIFGRLAGILLGSIFLLSGMAVLQTRAEEPKGTIEISLKTLSDGKTQSDRTGIAFHLYQVGTIDEHGQPSFLERYQMGAFPQESQEQAEAADALKGKVSDDSATTARTDASGQLKFDHLDRGVYLVTADETNAYGSIRPFLIQIPYYEEVNGALEGPNYDVKAEPKASWNTPSITPSTPPSGPSEKHHNSRTEGTVAESTDSLKSADPQAATAPRTGDDAQPWVWIALAAAMALILGASLSIWHRRKQTDDKGGEHTDAED